MKSRFVQIGPKDKIRFYVPDGMTFVRVEHWRIDDSGIAIVLDMSKDDQANAIIKQGYKFSTSRNWRMSFEWAKNRTPINEVGCAEHKE